MTPEGQTGSRQGAVCRSVALCGGCSLSRGTVAGCLQDCSALRCTVQACNPRCSLHGTALLLSHSAHSPGWLPKH